MTLTSRRIGRTEIHPVGLGLAGLSFTYPDDTARAAAVVGTALDSGVQLLDTAYAYTTATENNHNERLLARALRKVPPRDRPVISTKGGHFRDGGDFPVDGRPATLRRHCEASLRSLEVEQIDLYFLHWPDPDVPVAESVGALAELRQAGKIAHIGVSNVDLPQLEEAEGAAEIAAVQNPFSLFRPGRTEVLEHCERNGQAFLAYSPLQGRASAGPRLTELLDELATAYGAEPPQIALAWLLAKSPCLVAVSGAARPTTVRSSAAAAALALSDQHLDLLDRHAGS